MTTSIFKAISISSIDLEKKQLSLHISCIVFVQFYLHTDWNRILFYRLAFSVHSIARYPLDMQGTREPDQESKEATECDVLDIDELIVAEKSIGKLFTIKVKE